mgnify:CR=1 FL=1
MNAALASSKMSLLVTIVQCLLTVKQAVARAGLSLDMELIKVGTLHF